MLSRMSKSSSKIFEGPDAGGGKGEMIKYLFIVYINDVLSTKDCISGIDFC